MSFEQTTRYTCDLCGKYTEKMIDLLRGWRWFRGRTGVLQHACPECSVPPNTTSAPMGSEAAK